MSENAKMTESVICGAIFKTCIRAMNEMRPGEHVKLSFKCQSIRIKTYEHINEALREEVETEAHPDGSLTIRAGNVFAIAVPEEGKWRVQGFYLLVESIGFRVIQIETKPLTTIGIIDGPLDQSPVNELARIMGLFSLI